jgi:hypothetical protein
MDWFVVRAMLCGVAAAAVLLVVTFLPSRPVPAAPDWAHVKKMVTSCSGLRDVHIAAALWMLDSPYPQERWNLAGVVNQSRTGLQYCFEHGSLKVD